MSAVEAQLTFFTARKPCAEDFLQEGESYHVTEHQKDMVACLEAEGFVPNTSYTLYMKSFERVTLPRKNGP